MAKLKSERHHWWPENVSELWADPKGGVHWLSPDGKVRRSTPANFGVIGNGHLIKLGADPHAYNPWDESFESEFQNADSNFPHVIRQLDRLDRCGPPFERPVADRIMSQDIPDELFEQLIECVISLAARSPSHREKGAAYPEQLRGRLPMRERNALIGVNIRHTLRNALRNTGGRGKILVLFSPEREFIFGDGFFNNLTLQGDHWHNPKILAPLTPWMSVLFTRPLQYTTNPRLFTMTITSAEADGLNQAVQIYSKDTIFYRSERPIISEDFAQAKHRIFADHRNSVDELIHSIPGVPPRDKTLDFLDLYLPKEE